MMSHRSKLTEIVNANALGYKTYLYFVCLDDPLLNVSRVNDRLDKGGHSVPTDRIFTRYDNSLTNLIQAVRIAPSVFLLDNSGSELVLIAELENGEIIWEIEKSLMPNWYLEYVVNKM